MDEVMAEYISNLDLGLINEFKQMTVIPLFHPHHGPEYLTLKEALDQDLLIITELNEEGRVGELKLKNLAHIPILILDGEEIIGAKQNRVLNTTILVAPETEIPIPVSCTEQGRWSHQTPRFKDSNHIAANRVRRRQAVTVKDNLEKQGTFRSNQRAVWNEINQLSLAAEVNSETRAMKDVYQHLNQDLKEYTQAFPYQEGQKGILVLINGEVAGFEAVSSTRAYKNLHDKLIKSYATDAILKEAEPKEKDKTEEAKKFMEQTKKSEETKHKSVSYGCDHRFEGKNIIGSSLTYKKHVIHSTFFKPNFKTP